MNMQDLAPLRPAAAAHPAGLARRGPVRWFDPRLLLSLLQAVLLLSVSAIATANDHSAGSDSASPSLSSPSASSPSSHETTTGSIRFVGQNLFATAEGVFHQWRVLESRIDLMKPSQTFALVEIDLRSVDTGIERRDNHLRDPDFFETETYPTATARVHSLQPATDGAESFDLLIDLDLHGVQKTVPGQARLISRDPVIFRGETSIDRTDFGIGPAPSRWNPATPKAEIPILFEAAFGSPQP